MIMDAEHEVFHRFDAAAHEALDSQFIDSGFQCTESRADLVRYESPLVYFEVGYSVGYDFEVYARIGRIGYPGVLPDDPSERLDFGLVLAVADPCGYAEHCQAVPHSIATSDEQVKTVLAYIAAGLRTHGRPLLAGESGAYEKGRGLRFWHAPDVPPDALAGPTHRRWC
jgi:hypothetical protein